MESQVPERGAAQLPINGADFRKNLCEIKSKHYLCSALHSDWRGKLAKTAGIFYARSHRFHTPLRCVNAPAASHGEEQRVSMKPFYSYACLTF
ncbi:hypothetical protein [Alistipes putredinis]|uniref:hypothetical protein n=1 Tax=Alistipes putredinis TaxID=28117 RepID=UPI003AB78A95